MPPCTGTLAPHTPLRPGGGGDRHARVVAHPQHARPPRRPIAGSARPRPRGGPRAVERPDHRQRPPVAARLGDAPPGCWSTGHDRRAAGRAPRAGHLGDACRAAGSRDAACSRGRRPRSAAIDARYAATSRVALGVATTRARARAARPPSAAAAADASRASSRARVRRREHVVERAGHLVAHRVHGLGLEVRQPRHQRLAELGIGVDQRLHDARLGAVPAGEVLVRAGFERGVRRRVPSPPSRRRCFVRERRSRLAEHVDLGSTVSSAMRRYVVSLPPVTVTTPLGATRTECRRDRSAVRSSRPVRSSGRSPAHVPTTSASVSLSSVTPLTAPSR